MEDKPAKVVIGYHKTTCGMCQGRGYTERAVWDYPEGTRTIWQKPCPGWAARRIERIKKRFLQEHTDQDNFNRRFWQRVFAKRSWPFSGPGPTFRTFTKLSWTMASLVIAESYGWTPATERQFEKRFKWYNVEIKGPPQDWYKVSHGAR